MLEPVAEDVFIHTSDFVQSNAVVVRGPNGVLLIDPGVYQSDLDCLAEDLGESGQRVAVGFSTHPHWDHLLWHPAFGAAPRYATALGAATARDRLSRGVEQVARAAGIPEDVPLELLGQIEGLPLGATEIPWDGTRVTIVEHRAHASGHAALVIEDSGVLVAGDMLSDVLIPMLDLGDATDPVASYLAALKLLEEASTNVEVVVPGHGSLGRGVQLRDRVSLDRAYLDALRDGHEVADPRLDPAAYGKDFLPDVHARQLEHLARKERE